MRRVVVLVVALAAVGACGGGEEERADGDPAVFMTGLVRSVVAGNYAKAWESLHPAHQLVAARAAYLACERRDHVASQVDEIDVVRVVDERVTVAGEDGTSTGAAVTLRVLLRSAAGGERNGITNTFHAVTIENGWVWILPPARYRAYREGRCP